MEISNRDYKAIFKHHEKEIYIFLVPNSSFEHLSKDCTVQDLLHMDEGPSLKMDVYQSYEMIRHLIELLEQIYSEQTL